MFIFQKTNLLPVMVSYKTGTLLLQVFSMSIEVFPDGFDRRDWDSRRIHCNSDRKRGSKFLARIVQIDQSQDKVENSITHIRKIMLEVDARKIGSEKS